MPQKNSRKISILSFVLCLGVIFIHTYNLGIYGIESLNGFVFRFETFTNKLASGICVPYFFAISGFLFFRNFDLSCLTKKYKSRFHSILLPYSIWSTIYYLFFVFLTMTPLSRFMNGSIEVEFGIKAYLDYVWNGYYTLWFLRVLIWMILCAPLLWLFLKQRKYYWPEPVLALLIFLSIKEKSVLFFNIYYILGAYLGINYSKWIAKGVTKQTVLLAGLCLLGLVAMGGTYSGTILYNCAFICSSWLVLDFFAFDKELPWWMKCTFFFYCGHDMILESVEKAILIVFGKSEAMALIDYIVAPFITVFILIGIAYLLKTYGKPVWKILNGGR